MHGIPTLDHFFAGITGAQFPLFYASEYEIIIKIYASCL
jgi:hypothetical protein